MTIRAHHFYVYMYLFLSIYSSCCVLLVLGLASLADLVVADDARRALRFVVGRLAALVVEQSRREAGACRQTVVAYGPVLRVARAHDQVDHGAHDVDGRRYAKHHVPFRFCLLHVK